MNANYGRGTTRRRIRIFRRIRRIVIVAAVAGISFLLWRHGVFQTGQRDFVSGHHAGESKPVDVAFEATEKPIGGATVSASTGKSSSGFAAIMFGERDIIPLDTDGHRMTDLEAIFGRRPSPVTAPSAGGGNP
jgi:hypothetical protein